MDPELYQDVSDTESLSSRQVFKLLANSSQVTEATDLVQSGAFPLLSIQGDIPPSSHVNTGFIIDDSKVMLGIEALVLKVLKIYLNLRVWM